MRKLATATYAINLAQMSNMALTALAVPLLIGATSYGKYAAVFAVPALLQSTIEAFAVLSLHRTASDRSFWTLFVLLSLGALIVSGAVSLVVFDELAACLAVAMGAALLFRSAASALTYSHPTLAFVKATVIAEGAVTLAYAAILVGALALGLRAYYVPILMISAGAVLSGALLFKFCSAQAADRPDDKPSIKDARFSLVDVRLLASRLHEDAMITLMPLFLAANVGLVAAGEFRFLVSLMKVLSKLFPFRYEVVMRGVRSGEFDATRFAQVSLAFVVFGLGFAALAYFSRGWIFIGAESSMWLVALSTGPLVVSLAAFPVATYFSGAIPLLAIAVSTVTIAATFAGGLTAFLTAFVAGNILVYLATIIVLVRQQASAVVSQSPGSL